MTQGFEFYTHIIGSLRGELVLFSALLFFAGLSAASPVVERELQPLLRYPLWLWRHVGKWLQPGDRFLKMVLLIVLLNAGSLLANILSGLLGVLPFVFAFLIGLHVGVIVIVETGRRNLLGILLNPVAFIELPATWISLSIGMELGLSQLQGFSFSGVLPLLLSGLLVYGTLILPLLVIAAFTEVSLIKWGLRLTTRVGEKRCPHSTEC